MGQARRQRLSRRGRKIGLYCPELGRNELLDLGFAFADQAERNRLDAPRRPAARQLSPQDRRQGESHQIVQPPPREIGFDEPFIETARVLDRFKDRVLGDFVEYDPLYVDAVQSIPVAQNFLHVP